MTDATDPFRKFFDEIGFRLDLYPTLAPVGQAWPAIETCNLFNVWLRDNQQRRELPIRENQVKTLQAKVARLRAWIEDECPACGGLVAFDASKEPTP